jgi:ABC-type Zn uptake system ZnuABC Zn-binding protein ZnuA
MRLLYAALFLGLTAAPSWSFDTIRVVTTLPDLADWSRQIGGDRVKVRSLLQGFENPHTYEPKVSDVKAVAGSRVLVEVGLGLEEWLEGVVQNARNSELLTVVAAKGVEVIQEGAGHREGPDPHPLGNPHVRRLLPATTRNVFAAAPGRRGSAPRPGGGPFRPAVSLLSRGVALLRPGLGV